MIIQSLALSHPSFHRISAAPIKGLVRIASAVTDDSKAGGQKRRCLTLESASFIKAIY